MRAAAPLRLTWRRPPVAGRQLDMEGAEGGGPAWNGTFVNATEGDLEAVQMFAIVLSLYYTPVLCVVGCAGNVASVVVFSLGAKLRNLSSSYYLGALAVSDSLFLLAVLGSWLQAVLQLTPSAVYCKATQFASYTCCFLSAWLVVAFTVERFVAVRYPLRRPSVCTVARAKCVLAVLTAVALASYSPMLWYVSVEQVGGPRPQCYILEPWRGLAHVLNDVDTVASMLLPFSAIAALNAAICATVWRLAHDRRSMTVGDGAAAAGGRHRARGPADKAERSDRSQIKVTKMLLVVSSVFLVLNLPSYVIRIIAFNHTDKDEEDSSPGDRWLLAALQHVANTLFHTNFGINFALYCVSGQNFRQSLVSMCCPRLARRRTPDSTQGTVLSEYHMRSGGSLGRRRATSINCYKRAGSWRDAHEMLPLTK